MKRTTIELRGQQPVAQCNTCGRGEVSSDSGYSLKIELAGFADGKRGVKDESKMEK